MPATTRSPFLRTYVALALLAALGGYIYFVEIPRGDDPMNAKDKVFAFDADAVASITVERDGDEPLRVARAGDGWQIETPLEAPADTTEVDSLLSSIVGLEIQSVVTEQPGDLAAFGLAEPKLRVQVALKEGPSPVRLAVGGKAPDDSATYAQVAGESRVIAVATFFESSVDKRPFDLRDRDLLHVDRDAIKTIRVSGPEGDYALAKRADGQWSFTEPLATLAGRWSISTLLSTLEGLRMDEIAAEPAGELAAFGLDAPARRVELGLADGHTKTLEIGSETESGAYHAREVTRDLVAVIPSRLVDDLAKGMGELRAKRLIDVATYEVDRLSAQIDGQTRRYERGSDEGSDWRRSEPDPADVERTKVDDALFDLGGLEATEFVDAPGADAQYGLDAPHAVVTLRRGEENGELTVEIGKTDDAYYARRPDDAAILKLTAEPVEKVLKALLEL